MIGLAASADDLEIAAEFFELFKTPWEPAVPSRKYAVVLSAGQPVDSLDANLIVLYDSQPNAVDARSTLHVEPVPGPSVVEWNYAPLPLYGGHARFGAPAAAGTLRTAGSAVEYRIDSANKAVWR